MSVSTPSSRAIYGEFSAFAAREIAPWLAEREACRKKAVVRFLFAVGAGAASGAALLFFKPFAGSSVEAAFLALVAGGALGAFLLDRTRTEITHGLLDRIASYFGFTYTGKTGRPPLYDDYRRLKLLPGHNRERFEDEVRGVYEGAPFTLCEAHLEVKTKGRNSHRRTVFHGQLVAIDYPKRFLGSTVILRDMGPLNGLTRPSKNYSRVGIASPRFEKSFEAWSTDQVEARDLLDPIVLERFEELERLFGGKKLRAAFDGGKLLIAIETGDRLTIGTMFRPIDGDDRIETILKEFDVVFDLIDVLLKRLSARTDGAFSLADVKASAHER